MPILILLLLFAWPVLEIFSIVQVSRWIGVFPMILLLVAGAVIGGFLVQLQNKTLALRVIQAVRAGIAPEKALLQAATTSMAGILLMIPGFFSDGVAVLLLIPQMRGLIWRTFSSAFGGGQPAGPRVQPEAQGPKRPSDKFRRADDVIDVEYTEVPRDQSSGGSSAKRSDSPWGKAG